MKGVLGCQKTLYTVKEKFEKGQRNDREIFDNVYFQRKKEFEKFLTKFERLWSGYFVKRPTLRYTPTL